MEYRILSRETVDMYLTYLKKAMSEEPDMMCLEALDEEGIRRRVDDPFFQKTVSLLAVERGQVLGRIEYHFYGCIQDGFRMAYVDWVYVLKEHRHKGVAQGLFREFERRCRENGIDQYFLIRAENPNADRFYGAFDNAESSSCPVLRKNVSPQFQTISQ